MIKKYFYFILLALFFTSCSYKSEQKLSFQAQINQTKLTVVQYDATTAVINIQTSVPLQGVTNLNQINFHTKSDCSDAVIGTGLLKDLLLNGITAKVSSTSPSSLFFSTNTLSSCYSLGVFNPNFGNPNPPQFLTAMPSSPSHTSYLPIIIGTSDLVVGTLNLYSDSVCSALIGTGTTQQWNSSGIIATLSPNTTTIIYAQAVDSFSKKSTCTLMTSFQHATVSLPSPVFVKSTTVSPTNNTLNPNIIGTVVASAVSVTLFSDTACSNQIGVDTAANFTSTGVVATVAPNTSTDIYAQAYDASGGASACAYMLTFVHDNIMPAAPVFSLANPVSPTRLTTYPKITGLASADTVTVKFFNSLLCLTAIGSGTKAQFESSGILASVQANNITSIYAEAFDAAGNPSVCTHLTDYTHNAIPPDPPIYSMTNPTSPTNLTITPFVLGQVPVQAVTVNFYSDASCSVLIGQGPASNFANPGIPVTAQSNASTFIYAQDVDAPGNISSCVLLTEYQHSTAAAPVPTFTLSVPASPSRISNTPYIVGAASASIIKVELFSDNICTSSLGVASRATFMSSGLRVNVSQNTINSIYGVSTDKFGNKSACTFLVNYIHDNVAPFSPSVTSILPLSPNNISATPILKGTTTVNPASVLPIQEVAIYDNLLCLNKIGTGTPSQFSGAGIQATVLQNSSTSFYSKTIDAAGNTSPCTYFADYIYDTLVPGHPIFGTVNPLSPSYSQNIKIKGTISVNSDIVPIASINFYSNSTCTTLLSSDTQTIFTSIGVNITVPVNVVTSIYANSTNTVGTPSACTKMLDFTHYNQGPGNLVATGRADGGVFLSWNSDIISSPIPQYTVKRSLKSGGPYSVLAWINNGTSFIDYGVKNNTTYYYTVSATNITGFSQDSAEAAILVSASNPTAVGSLQAIAGVGNVSLSWSAPVSNMYFKIYRATQSGGPYSLIQAGLSSTVFVDSSVVNGTQYYYIVRGLNPAGEGFNSNEVAVMSMAPPASPIGLALARETVSAVCGGKSAVHLSWTAPSYYTSFNIYRGNGAGTETLLTNVGTITNYDDCSSPAGISNYYYVTADFGSGQSSRSNEVGLRSTVAPSLTVKPGHSEIIVSWMADPYAIAYRLFRGTKSGGPYTQVTSAGFSGTVFQDTSLVDGTAYYYVLDVEYSGNIFGFFSNEAGAIPAVNTGAPTNLVLSVDSTGNPILAWTPPFMYNDFSVYRSSTLGGTYVYLQNSASYSFTDTSPLAGLNYYKIKSNWGFSQSVDSNIVSYRNAKSLSLTATGNAGNISLAWSSVAGVASYNIFRSLNSGGPYTFLANTAVLTYTDSTAAGSTGYYYVVQPKFADLTVGQNSTEASAIRSGTMIPSGLTVVNTNTSMVDLVWAQVPGAVSYKIYASTSSGGTYVLESTAVSTHFTVSSLNSNSAYYFKVTSVDGSSVESAKSNWVGAPTVNQISINSVIPKNNGVFVSWNFSSGATYTVSRSTDGVTFTQIASGLVSGSYLDATTVNNQIYFYQVTAAFAAIPYSSNSLMSSGVSALSTSTPLVPQGLTVIGNTTGTDIALNWPTVTGATGYNVYYSTTSGSGYTLASGATVSGLTTGVTYYFVVTALNGTIESGYSNEVSSIPTLPAVAPVAIVNVGGASIDLSWSSVSGASSYNIYRTSDRENFQYLANVVGLSYTDSTALSQVTYYYQFIPVNASSVSMATSGLSNGVAYGVSPLAPTGVVAIGTSTTSIKISWTPTPAVNSYSIYRGTVSGGPYTLLANVLSTAPTVYSDLTVISGNTYFYVLRALNISGAASANSSEVAVSLVNPIINLAGVSTANMNQLTWSSLPSAVSYNVLRSDLSGGPYGLIASGVAGTSYQDTNIKNSSTYYYMVQGVSAGGVNSTISNEAIVVSVVSVNLEVPIELTDRALQSSMSVATIFERTRTSFNTSDYDGTVTYFFEVVAINSDSASQVISIVDSSGVVKASVTVPANTNQWTRSRVVFSPNVGRDTYRISLSGSTSVSQLQVSASRIIVHQVGATKTRIYIPLLSASTAGTPSDINAWIESTGSTNYSQLQTTSIYQRNTTAMSSLEDFNAWELEALVSVSTGATGLVALNNTSLNQIVLDTETLINSTAITMVNSSFNEGTPNFSLANENQLYEVTLRCFVNCTSASVNIYKAGLWVSLKNITQAALYYREAQSISTSVASTVDTERTLFDATVFSNPSVYFSASGMAPVAGSMSVYLLSDNVNDSGGTSLAAIPGSTLSYNSSQKFYQKTAAPISITSGLRYMPSVLPSGGVGLLNDATMIIQISK